MKLPTIFFGASAYVLPIIESLHKNYDLKLVVTTEKNPTDAVPSYCTKNNIPYVSVTTLKDDSLRTQLSNFGCQFAILADFKLLVKKGVIDIFPKGIINIHPSLLPEYRGPTPGTTAILDGKATTGVSLMLLNEKMDEGPILGQTDEKILPEDTSGSLYPRLFKKGTELLEKILPDYLSGKIEPKSQDSAKATYTKFLTRDSGYIDLSQSSELMDHDALERMIRAYFPWPGVWTKATLAGKEKIIKLLPKNMLQVEGKKPMSYKDFVNGYLEGKEILEKLGLL